MKATRDDSSPAARRARRRRSMVWSMAFILLGAMIAPLGGYLYAMLQPAAEAQPVSDTNPRANYWRAVREGVSGYTAVRSPEAGVLIQSEGQNWRSLRNGPLATYGAWVMGAALAVIVLFYLVRGSVKLEQPRTGRKVKRWNAFERLVHAYTATLFVVLAITGLSLLFGRAVLIPLLGKEGFGVWASLAKTLHNYLGPAFAVGVVLIILMWLRDNLPAKGDLEWFKSGGGIVGKKHPHAGRMNAGEKVWFWTICTVGVVAVASGLYMDFPDLGGTRSTLQIASLVHAALAMLWVAGFLGHAYIGTIGSEGSLEAMTTGYVDESWAKQHHDLWYEEVKHQDPDEGKDSAPASMAPQQG